MPYSGPTVVQAAAYTTVGFANSCNVTLNGMTPGNSIIVCCMDSNPGTLAGSSIADTLNTPGNPYSTVASAQNGGTSRYSVIYRLDNCAGGNNTITWNITDVGGGFPTMMAFEVTPLGTTDQTLSNNFPTGPTASIGTITPSVANTLAFFVGAHSNLGGPDTVGAPWSFTSPAGTGGSGGGACGSAEISASGSPLSASLSLQGGSGSTVYAAMANFPNFESTCATPAITPATGTYDCGSGGVELGMTCSTPGSSIYYTTDGTTPTYPATGTTTLWNPLSPEYLDSTSQVQAIGVAAGFVNSAVASNLITITYTISGTILDGSNNPVVGVAITCTGQSPTTTASDGTYSFAGLSNVTSYTVTPSFTGWTFAPTDQVVAVNSANQPNINFTGTHLQVATPTFSPLPGTFGVPTTVTVSDVDSAFSGFAMYYTLDGSTPTTGSTLYTGPITISTTQTLKVLAVATAYSNSAIASGTYTISSGGILPIFGTGVTSTTGADASPEINSKKTSVTGSGRTGIIG